MPAAKLGTEPIQLRFGIPFAKREDSLNNGADSTRADRNKGSIQYTIGTRSKVDSGEIDQGIGDFLASLTTTASARVISASDN